MQNITKITKYDNCDILISYGDVSPLGFQKNKTLGEMIDLAILNQCPIIVKNGKNGKWYLKGKNRDINDLKTKINNNIGKYRDGCLCFLIE